VNNNAGDRRSVKAAAKRQRDAERVARLLKEYAAKLNRIANRLHVIRELSTSNHAFSHFLEEVVALLHRRAAIAGVLESLTRAASGMIEHYELASVDYAELVLRTRETEQALDEARMLANILIQQYPKFIPTEAVKDMAFEWPKSVAAS
jgi:hypothetical protein